MIPVTSTVLSPALLPMTSVLPTCSPSLAAVCSVTATCSVVPPPVPGYRPAISEV